MANVRVYQRKLVQSTRRVDLEYDYGHTYLLPAAGIIHRNDVFPSLLPSSLLPQTVSPFHSLSSRGAAKGRSRCREVAFDEYQHTIVLELGVDHDYSRVHMRSGRLEVCSLTATRSTSAGSNGAGEQ